MHESVTHFDNALIMQIIKKKTYVKNPSVITISNMNPKPVPGALARRHEF